MKGLKKKGLKNMEGNLKTTCLIQKAIYLTGTFFDSTYQKIFRR